MTVRHILRPRQKGGDLTQFYDKSPYTHGNVKRAVTTQTTPQKSSIKQRLRTDFGRSVGVPTATQLVWFTRFTGPNLPNQYKTKCVHIWISLHKLHTSMLQLHDWNTDSYVSVRWLEKSFNVGSIQHYLFAFIYFSKSKSFKFNCLDLFFLYTTCIVSAIDALLTVM